MILAAPQVKYCLIGRLSTATAPAVMDLTSPLAQTQFTRTQEVGQIGREFQANKGAATQTAQLYRCFKVQLSCHGDSSRIVYEHETVFRLLLPHSAVAVCGSPYRTYKRGCR